jgi:hypothetical protein
MAYDNNKKTPAFMTRIHLLGILVSLLIIGLIVAIGPYSNPAMFLPDQGFAWYYWKLPEPTFWTRFSVWGLYGVHQLGLWGLIAYAQAKRPAYSGVLHPVNVAAIVFNLVFIGLHILQTRYFYDGLAQDTAVASSQFSVIFMLVFILIMENRRRGLFFGRSIDFVDKPAGFLRHYHGYYFSWAIVYTFWFHPIEDNIGHLLGNFYTFLLLFQGSLFFTRYHRDRVWTCLLEVFVLIHGAMVAYLTISGDHWKMFIFGFLAMFVITQMHGIGLGVRARWALLLTCIGCIAINYADHWPDAIEVFRIPAAEYGIVYVIAAIAWTPTLWRKWRAQPAS